MSRIPNPFGSGEGQQQHSGGYSSSPGHQSSGSTATPGFLIMTRPPSGSNRYGGRGYKTQVSPSHPGPSEQKNSFIPFSSSGGGNSSQESTKSSSGGRGRYNRGGGGRHFSTQGSPRFAYPYQQSPGRINNYGQNQDFPNTPRCRPNQGGRRFSDMQDRSFGDQKKFNSNDNSRRGRDRGPLSDVPIDKFISHNMVKDPWADFDEEVEDNVDSVPVHPQENPIIVTLDDSEIIIDSDASVIIENSYEEGISGTEGDSSPVHDTGSDSPYVATPSTSEKDTGSDSTSDA